MEENENERKSTWKWHAPGSSYNQSNGADTRRGGSEKGRDQRSSSTVRGNEMAKPIWKNPEVFALFLLFVFFSYGVMCTVSFWLGLGLLILGGIYVRKSIYRISVEQLALKFRFDTLVEGKVYTNGQFLAWYGIEKFWIVDTEIIEIDLKSQEVHTKEKVVNGKTLDSVVVVVDAIASCRVPRTFAGLKKLLIEAPDPKKIPDLFKGFVAGSIRNVLSKKSWLEVRGEEKEEFSKQVVDTMKRNEEHPVIVAGIEDIYVNIEHIQLPKPLTDAILNRQNAYYDKETLAIKTKADANRTRVLGQAEADNRRAMMKAMAEDPHTSQQIMFENMAKGSGTTVFAALPGSVYEGLELSNEQKKRRLFAKEESSEERIPEEDFRRLMDLSEGTIEEIAKKMGPQFGEKLLKAYSANKRRK